MCTRRCYCIFSTIHLVHLWVSEVEHLKGVITLLYYNKYNKCCMMQQNVMHGEKEMGL